MCAWKSPRSGNIFRTKIDQYRLAWFWGGVGALKKGWVLPSSN